MKQTIMHSAKQSFLIFCLLIGFVACEKNENTLTEKEQQKTISKIFKARLVSSFCAYSIVQIQDSAFYSYGMDWTDTRGITYQYVFAVKNYCDFAAANLDADETFNCKIVDKASNENCVICLGFMETPPLLHNINVVR